MHGDLWSGNALTDNRGRPALIDPSAHWGWAEADLGMTSLFGGFPEAFYAAYEAARPQVSGWRQRADVYQLYHLLNHLNLFGSSYHSQVMRTCLAWNSHSVVTFGTPHALPVCPHLRATRSNQQCRVLHHSSLKFPTDGAFRPTIVLAN